MISTKFLWGNILIKKKQKKKKTTIRGGKKINQILKLLKAPLNEISEYAFNVSFQSPKKCVQTVCTV